ncbi:bifunctional DNA primase/helicase [Joostella sp.]|uniref:bifunctional DNA primase/helicase n=1 Tax=Joostella sp. TaxID=2231138 RepID=UPI003A90185D
MDEFFDWENIDLKGKMSGSHKFKCPECIDTRSNKSDKSLSVDITKGVAFCHYCNKKSLKDFDREQKAQSYELPKQNWINYTELSENLVKWLENERKISQSTAIDLKVTEEVYYQPAAKKEVNNLVFNYFEGEKVVNKKYRTWDKKFTQSKGGKSIFYNINSIIGQKECYIVEGEFDVLALREVGIKNAISVPNGANDNDDYWKNSEQYLSGIEKFYICTDNDIKGNDLSEKIAQRLGRWRCERIEFEYKDANGDLIAGILENSIKNVKRYPVSGTFTVSDLSDDIDDLYENGLPETIYPKSKSFGGLKDIFSTMRGHLVIVTGIPSHGKSNTLDWYVMNLLEDYGMKGSWFSPEHHPMQLHHASFAQRFIGKPFFGEVDGVPRMSVEEKQLYKDWADERIYFTGPEKNESPTWKWLFDKFNEQMYAFGIDIFVVDAFNKVQFDKKGNRLDLINEVLTELTSFAQRNNVIIFVVAHPTKMQKNQETGLYSCPSLYDVSGSADFRNQTHDGFAIYRYFENEDTGVEDETEFINLKTKFSFQGKIGEKIRFKYHLPSGRYYASDSEYIPGYLNNPIEEKEDSSLPFVNPSDAFDLEEKEDDIPF